MTNTKMTKKDWFAILTTIVETSDVENKSDILNFINHEVELLNKKSSKSAPTKNQEANLEIMENIKLALAECGESVTVSELMAKSEEMAKYTNQKLSALLKKLVDSNEVVKTIEKKKSYFSIVKGV